MNNYLHFLYLYVGLYLLLIYPSCRATVVCHRKGRLCLGDLAVFTGKVSAPRACCPSVNPFFKPHGVILTLDLCPSVSSSVPQVSWSQPPLKRSSKPTIHPTFCSQLLGRSRPVRHRQTMMTATWVRPLSFNRWTICKCNHSSFQ